MGLDLYREGERVLARVRLSPEFAGFEGFAHGGIVAALLDEVMAWAAMTGAGRPCMTGEMAVRYLRPVPVSEEITAREE